MSNQFDPYQEWLGADSSTGSINYYQLLGLKDFENDPERIENAEMAQMAKVLRQEAGPHSQHVPKLCEQLETAVRCLCNPATKARYDAQLRAEQSRRHSVDTSASSLSSSSEASSRSNGALRNGYDPAADLLQADSEDVLGGDFPGDAASRPKRADSSTSPSALHRPTQSNGPKSTTSRRPTVSNDEEDVLAGDDPAHRRGRSGDRSNSSLSSASSMSRRNSQLGSTKGHPAGQSSVSRLNQRAGASTIGKRSSSTMPDIPWRAVGAVVAVIAFAFLAMWFLPALWSSGPSPGPYLAKLNDPDPLVRLDGIDALRFLDLSATKKTQLLIKLLNEDRDDNVRIAAVNSMTMVGKLPDDSIPELKLLLASEKHPSVKHMLIWLIDQAEKSSP